MINVNVGSSIWKLGTYWGTERLPNNFCDLSKRVIWCFIVVTLSTIGFGFYLSYLIASIAASFSVGFIIWSMPIFFLVGILSCILTIVAASVAKVTVDEVMESESSGKLNYCVEVCRSIKGKFCPMVNEVN